MNWSVLAALAFAFALNVPAAIPPKSAECLTCHDDKGAGFQNSVHGSFSCTDCHTTINPYPHSANGATVSKFRCDTCHKDPVAGVAASVHSSPSAQACQGCHSDAHAILPASDPKSGTYASNLPRTCGTCHGDAKFAKQHKISEVYSLYIDSIHGFALTKDGLLVAASCSSCHGSHKILSKTNPASRTNPANIAETCGKCHAGPTKDFMAGIHGQGMAMETLAPQSALTVIRRTRSPAPASKPGKPRPALRAEVVTKRSLRPTGIRSMHKSPLWGTSIPPIAGIAMDSTTSGPRMIKSPLSPKPTSKRLVASATRA